MTDTALLALTAAIIFSQSAQHTSSSPTLAAENAVKDAARIIYFAGEFDWTQVSRSPRKAAK